MIIRRIKVCSDEQGVIIVFAALLVLVLFYLGALVVDLARTEYTLRILQKSVDAASLAGSIELALSGNIASERWKNSKRAALSVLKENLTIRDHSFPRVDISGHHVGPSDRCEMLGDYHSQIYDNGEIRVELERGFYDDTGDGSFSTREDATTCNDTSSPPSNAAPNAVRVTAVIYNYTLVFAPYFNRTSLDSLTRSAIGGRVK